MSKIAGRSALLLFACLAAIAAARDVQASSFCDPRDTSTAEVATSGTGPYSVMVTPDGSGDPFTAAADAFGNPTDVTITYTLRDCSYVPIANFPFEDLWLEAADGGLAACIGGTTADANTDAQGRASWTQPLLAGASSAAGCVVMVSGAPGIYPPYLPIHFNSPDVNGDGHVNLVDVPLFATDYFGGVYAYRSDLHRDGQINLADLVRFAGALGAGCP